MPLKIIAVGEPVLRQKACALSREEILSARVQELIVEMRQTMHAAPGVGLAAPQVGESLQLAVIEDKPEYTKSLHEREVADRERRPVPFHVIVNPILQLQTERQIEFFEGCLSLPGFTALVPRAHSVRVECLDHRAERRIIEATGWYARILQHEIDHLNGTIYIDRMRSRSFSSVENLNQYWKAKSIPEVRRALDLEQNG
jgi:peptide deformylase